MRFKTWAVLALTVFAAPAGALTRQDDGALYGPAFSHDQTGLRQPSRSLPERGGWVMLIAGFTVGAGAMRLGSRRQGPTVR